MLIYTLLVENAGVAELADALDLGSSVFDVGVQVLSPAPIQDLQLSISENQKKY